MSRPRTEIEALQTTRDQEGRYPARLLPAVRRLLDEGLLHMEGRFVCLTDAGRGVLATEGGEADG